MKKTIRVIDLLNKIANGEEVPKKIRYFGEEFKLAKDNEYYSVYSSRSLISYFGEDYLRAELNDEVEILDEEEFIDIEEITLNGEKLGYGVLSKWLGSKQTDNEVKLCSSIECLGITLNLLIKNQKKIIERINKEN
ncbi:MAG: hypothetical protein SPJ27_09040 [Candidatus Onthovivens sp.]|nr:hypothetical protein [Candidatus Onthovivens sp.]